MKIQWFPGHMHKAQKEIREILSGINVIIEVLDARIPFSSQNPLLAQIRGTRPCIKVLHKHDLADDARTREWLNRLTGESGTEVLCTATDKPQSWKILPDLCRSLTPAAHATRPVHALIVGIPNVGKSTLINKLAGRTIARTGNEPAITKAQQRVDIGKGVVLRDTPGVLWPNLANRNSGYRLALTGAIRDTAMDSADVAMFAAEYLLAEHADRLRQRYHLDATIAYSATDLLEHIGKERGCLSGGGLVDFDRTARLLLTEFRAGMLGRMTLETPSMMDAELAQLQQQQTEQDRKKQKKPNRRPPHRNQQ